MREAAVVLSDHLMPDMSGTEFLARARERWPDSFRIMLTAYGDLETVISAVNVGEIHRFLSKPWDPRDLKLAISEGLERHRLIQENRELLRRLDAQNIELRSLNETLEARVAERTAQLEKAHAELVQTEKLSAVGRLAAGVVHEVLNPLSVAAGRVEMVMLDPNLSEEHGGSLKIGREQIDQAIQILDNLRDFSRRRPSTRSAVDLSALVSHTMQLIAHETTRRSIEVIEKLEDAIEVQADQDHLAQVFLNLANNAVDALGSGGRLTVETHAVAEGEHRMVDAVFEDTGPGIPEEDLARIFDPFFTTKEDGTGLGLSICQSIVKGHGGEIRVASEVGKGTRFVVRLPEEAPEGTNEE
jgi:signal transduction histidine kinase